MKINLANMFGCDTTFTQEKNAANIIEYFYLNVLLYIYDLDLVIILFEMTIN